jgi:hypothetical protein
MTLTKLDPQYEHWCAFLLQKAPMATEIKTNPGSIIFWTRKLVYRLLEKKPTTKNQSIAMANIKVKIVQYHGLTLEIPRRPHE